MTGLSVLLEPQKSFFLKYPHVISKTSLPRIPPATTPQPAPPAAVTSHDPSTTSPFLENCFLCRKRLLEGTDIYIYRGDRAFCSEDCRFSQICLDEESNRDNGSAAAADMGPKEVRGRRRGGGALAGGSA
ncbi:hypothetical protein AXF42_Ash016447 [Apostasia shenzhenica]|uniref:FLZ-type domain-containing protein n=1 Tax=Apostasia shenzhenica TaxID=1088818 RepID=A0A2I0A065_9ASPA|nr:hypothetical protein AXF42_Ash016447 [Apostasia shenzhenica]